MREHNGADNISGVRLAVFCLSCAVFVNTVLVTVHYSFVTFITMPFGYITGGIIKMQEKFRTKNVYFRQEKNPVFICSFSRSGTTLCQAIVQQMHSRGEEQQ